MMFTVRLCNSGGSISAETASFDDALSFVRDVTGCPNVYGAWQNKEDYWEMAVYNFDDSWGPHEPSAIGQIFAAFDFVPPPGTTWPPNNKGAAGKPPGSLLSSMTLLNFNPHPAFHALPRPEAASA